MVGVGEEAFHGRTDKDEAGRLIPTMVGTAFAVLHSAVVTEPEGSGGKDETVVEGPDVAIRAAQLLVLDPEEPAAPDQSRPRVGEGEEREVTVILYEALWDRFDPPPVLGDRSRVAEVFAKKELSEHAVGIHLDLLLLEEVLLQTDGFRLCKRLEIMLPFGGKVNRLLTDHPILYKMYIYESYHHF